MSVTSLLTIVAAPTAGWVSDRVGSRKVICTVPLLLMAFLFPLSSGVTENLFLVLAAGIGFAGGFVPTGVFTAGVEVVGDERMAGMAMAVIQIGAEFRDAARSPRSGLGDPVRRRLADRLLDPDAGQYPRSCRGMDREDKVKEQSLERFLG